MPDFTAHRHPVLFGVPNAGRPLVSGVVAQAVIAHLICTRPDGSLLIACLSLNMARTPVSSASVRNGSLTRPVAPGATAWSGRPAFSWSCSHDRAR